MSVFESFELSKYYNRTTGLAGLTMTIEDGELWAILGSQMSGKTTLLRLICGLIYPTSGSFELFDASRHQDNPTIKRMIGFAPARPYIEGNLTIEKYLIQSARMYGFTAKNSNIYDAIKSLCKRLDLDQSIKVCNLTFSAKKKVSFIAAAIHGPKLLLLDEPTLGLDAYEREKTLRLMRDLNSRGTTIMYTTKNIADAKFYSTHTAMLSDGVLIEANRTEDISALNLMKVSVSAGDANNDLARELGIKNYMSVDGVISFSFTGSHDTLVKLLSKYEIQSLTITEPSLESVLSSAAASKGVAV